MLKAKSWLNERPRPVPSPGGLVVKNGLMTVPYFLTSAEQMLIVELAGFDMSGSWKADRHAQCGHLFFAGLLAGNLVGPCRPRQQRFSAKLGVLALSNLFPPVRLGWSGWAF